jgi:outer membrane protein OmpA-like peptidoglycan-associated protein
MLNKFMNFLITLLACTALIAGCSSQPPQASASEKQEKSATAKTPANTVNQPAETEHKTTAAATDNLNIYFPPGSSIVSSIEREKLRNHAEHLKAEPQLKITLIGHTGDTGSPSFNLALADMRVSAVSNALKSLGIPERRIRRNMGERNRQAAQCKTAECPQSVQRVELVYILPARRQR